MIFTMIWQHFSWQRLDCKFPQLAGTSIFTIQSVCALPDWIRSLLIDALLSDLGIWQTYVLLNVYSQERDARWITYDAHTNELVERWISAARLQREMKRDFLKKKHKKHALPHTCLIPFYSRTNTDTCMHTLIKLSHLGQVLCSTWYFVLTEPS